jgi:hypothetical protein
MARVACADCAIDLCVATILVSTGVLFCNLLYSSAIDRFVVGLPGRAVGGRQMWFWQRRGRPEDNFGIAAGQRFRPVGSIPIIWEVESVARHPGEPVAHVRLHRVDVPSQGKTVALQVLRDKRYYQPAP